MVEKCECGRTFVRMKKVLGRSDDMLIIRGVNTFPSQIESVLVNISKYRRIIRYWLTEWITLIHWKYKWKFPRTCCRMK